MSYQTKGRPPAACCSWPGAWQAYWLCRPGQAAKASVWLSSVEPPCLAGVFCSAGWLVSRADFFARCPIVPCGISFIGEAEGECTSLFFCGRRFLLQFCGLFWHIYYYFMVPRRKANRLLSQQTFPSLSLNTWAGCWWYTGGTATKGLQLWASLWSTEACVSVRCRWAAPLPIAWLSGWEGGESIGKYENPVLSHSIWYVKGFITVTLRNLRQWYRLALCGNLKRLFIGSAKCNPFNS